MGEKFRNQVRFQNSQVIDLAILKPGFELARPFQNQGRFQNGQVNDLAVSKRPGFRNGREQYHHLTGVIALLSNIPYTALCKLMSPAFIHYS